MLLQLLEFSINLSLRSFVLLGMLFDERGPTSKYKSFKRRFSLILGLCESVLSGNRGIVGAKSRTVAQKEPARGCGTVARKNLSMRMAWS